MTQPYSNKRIELFNPPAGAPESEKAVLLAAILNHEQQAEIFQQLDSDYFIDQDYATLAKSAIRLWNTTGAVDLALLVGELKAKNIPMPLVLIGEITDSSGHTDNWQEHLAIIQDRCCKRQHHAALVADLERIQRGEPLVLIEPYATAVPAVNHHRALWPEPLANEAYHGIAGEFVRLIEPHTEADPVALLVQFLVAFGNFIGRTAHYRVEASQHFCNLNLVLVGDTANGRKGTSWGYIQGLFMRLDETWTKERIANGLSSGEGLIFNVRDPVFKPDKNGNPVETDSGIADKRLLVCEGEFGSVLKNMGRDKNILSAVIRNAWDGQALLQTMVKNDPNKATDAHISIIGHITRTELSQLLSACDSANGFANRFIWLCSKRSKQLPEGGNLAPHALDDIVRRLLDIAKHARRVTLVQRDPVAKGIWGTIYSQLSNGKPGLLGMALTRGPAQVMRLATIYALLDSSNVIRAEHLHAALAVWDYAEQSARYIFGAGTGSVLADRILAELVDAKPDGLTRTAIHKILNGHAKAPAVSKALVTLAEQNLANMTREKQGGKTVEVWRAV